MTFNDIEPWIRTIGIFVLFYPIISRSLSWMLPTKFAVGLIGLDFLVTENLEQKYEIKKLQTELQILKTSHEQAIAMKEKHYSYIQGQSAMYYNNLEGLLEARITDLKEENSELKQLLGVPNAD